MPSALAKKLYPLADLSFKTYGRVRARHYDPLDSIVIASSGRGGSTWLAEVLAAQPGKIMQWEPLHPGNNPVCKEYGFGWANYLPENADDLAKREYVHRLLSGRDLSIRTLTSLHFKPRSFIGFTGYILKFVNLNMMLPWLIRQFPVRTILLVRHPCAVVSSQMAHRSWRFSSKEQLTVPRGIFEKYPHFKGVFEDLVEPEELLAFDWAMQTYVPLYHPGPHSWLLTTYERMVHHGERELDRIFGYLGEAVPEESLETFRRASATTQAGSNVAEGKNPLTGWQERLSERQVSNILSVTMRMGVELYSEDLMPDAEHFETLVRHH